MTTEQQKATATKIRADMHDYLKDLHSALESDTSLGIILAWHTGLCVFTDGNTTGVVGPLQATPFTSCLQANHFARQIVNGAGLSPHVTIRSRVIRKAIDDTEATIRILDGFESYMTGDPHPILNS